jgi:hypothetical protein
MTQVIEFLRIWYPLMLIFVIAYLNVCLWAKNVDYEELKELCDDQQRWIDNEMKYQEKQEQLNQKDKPDEKYYGC